MLSDKQFRSAHLVHKLLVMQFKFLYPMLNDGSLTPTIRALHIATLRLLVVITQDFPGFLAMFHFSLCDNLPPICSQMRNLILSAIPPDQSPPDPMVSVFKWESLREMSKNPRILVNYTTLLIRHNLRDLIDKFCETRDKSLLPKIKNSLILPKERAIPLGYKTNVALANSLLLYLMARPPGKPPPLPTGETSTKGATDEQAPSDSAASAIKESPALEIIMYLTEELDLEGRYLFLNAIANHMRYPNSHTHYCASLLVWLFHHSSEIVKEQITRVLLERVVAHLPHPWGLIIAVMELLNDNKLFRCKAVVEDDGIVGVVNVIREFCNKRPGN
eukprot:Selendium_serpulae@DN5461_c0_g1_i2.p2